MLVRGALRDKLLLPQHVMHNILVAHAEDQEFLVLEPKRFSKHREPLLLTLRAKPTRTPTASAVRGESLRSRTPLSLGPHGRVTIELRS
jgi:hypothetical protein